MKLLDIPELSQLSAHLSGQTAHSRIICRIEAYSCKMIGEEKKTYKQMSQVCLPPFQNKKENKKKKKKKERPPFFFSFSFLFLAPAGCRVGPGHGASVAVAKHCSRVAEFAQRGHTNQRLRHATVPAAHMPAKGDFF
jgi:hypothetical protein